MNRMRRLIGGATERSWRRQASTHPRGKIDHPSENEARNSDGKSSRKLHEDDYESNTE